MWEGKLLMDSPPFNDYKRKKKVQPKRRRRRKKTLHSQFTIPPLSAWLESSVFFFFCNQTQLSRVKVSFRCSSEPKQPLETVDSCLNEQVRLRIWDGRKFSAPAIRCSRDCGLL
uniref:uncharacterized protein LOC105351495 n=1 Tax=Fragaria vesca subsp. vesca TaxID=101020 RepID=UPI0005C865C4|nr:PREDICTED: uncharacterized protein LOC105351495 [Fragaria vesca subsp. vesca]